MEKLKSRPKAVREYCVDCSGGYAPEVRLCPVLDCPLYPYRFGNVIKGEDLENHLEARTLMKKKAKG